MHDQSLMAAQERDSNDPLAAKRDAFVLPDGVIYLDGNSLGPLPRNAAAQLSSTVFSSLPSAPSLALDLVAFGLVTTFLPPPLGDDDRGDDALGDGFFTRSETSPGFGISSLQRGAASCRQARLAKRKACWGLRADALL